MLYNEARKPDYRQLEKVLRREAPDRPVLLELFLNEHIYATVPEHPSTGGTPLDHARNMTAAYERLGYDYMSMHINDFRFLSSRRGAGNAQTVSLNDGAMITDRASFDAYPWEEPADFGVDLVEAVGRGLPDGMRMILLGPGGVLENVIALTGYDNLCMMLYDDPALVGDIFEQVGTRLCRYYELAAHYPFVTAVFSNDDWGFNTQTMLSPADMRKYVFPWHRKIVDIAHRNGKFALLHSCGRYDEVIEDVITDMKFDGRHSYEDTICPVEKAYEDLCGRIAVLGGIDVDYMTRRSPQEIYGRARAMLERTASRGGYALGTGNSIAPYIPDENYFALIRAAAEYGN